MQHRNQNQQMPTFKTFIADQSECVNRTHEDPNNLADYDTFTRPKHRNPFWSAVRPVNQATMHHQNEGVLDILDVSEFGMNFNILRNNDITEDIGYCNAFC